MNRKIIKIIISFVLIFGLFLSSYSFGSDSSDGSNFVTKAEFDSALADFNSRLTTFEAGINSKIDSQVTSYLDRNGIWSGKEQEYNTTLFSGTSYASLSDYLWTSASSDVTYTYSADSPAYTNGNLEKNLVRYIMNYDTNNVKGFSRYSAGIFFPLRDNVLFIKEINKSGLMLFTFEHFTSSSNGGGLNWYQLNNYTDSYRYASLAIEFICEIWQGKKGATTADNSQLDTKMYQFNNLVHDEMSRYENNSMGGHVTPKAGKLYNYFFVSKGYPLILRFGVSGGWASNMLGTYQSTGELHVVEGDILHLKAHADATVY